MASDNRSPDQIEREFKAAVGTWLDGYDDWLSRDPQSFALFAAFATHVHQRGALNARERALIQVALAATATHLYRHGLESAIDSAFDAGATVDEIQEVLELTCGVGMHTMIEGLPPFVNELGTPEDDASIREARERVRADFEARRGYWSDFWETVLEMDHEYLARYTDLSANPWERGSLDPKFREFVYIAIDASTTHLYTPGLSAHLENAIEYGATRDELLEVLELTSLQGYDTMSVGMPILLERARERGLLEDQDDE